MASYLPRVDLDTLLKEISYSLDYEWGFYRNLHPKSLASAIWRTKEAYKKQLEDAVPRGHQVYEELRFNCTLAYQKKVVPYLVCENFGRFVASCALISQLLEYWDKLQGPKPSKKDRLQLLVVPFWLRLCNEKMAQEERKAAQMRHFRWGVYRELGMTSSSMRGLKDKELDTHWGSETTLVAPEEGQEQDQPNPMMPLLEQLTRSSQTSNQKVEEQEREYKSGSETGSPLDCQGQSQSSKTWLRETGV